ncbi:MAG: preprotein translocase subunit SecE [Alphaproteobacteria bacterium]|nr:preprotein translocase subunit SecE [Alphaproteobacteria bacterium]
MGELAKVTWPDREETSTPR